MIINNLQFLQDSYILLPEEWKRFIDASCYNELLEIDKKIRASYLIHEIYPPKESIFKALQ